MYVCFMKTKAPSIKLSIAKFRGEERLFVHLPRNKHLTALIKEVPGARWSQSKKTWHVPDDAVALLRLQQKFEPTTRLDLTEVEKYTDKKLGKAKKWYEVGNKTPAEIRKGKLAIQKLMKEATAKKRKRC